MALLKNVQLNKTGHDASTFHQDSEYNTQATAFTSFAGTQITDQKPNLCLLSSISDWNDIWIIDTGASDHMCHNKSLLTSLMALLKPSIVILPYGQRLTGTHT